MSNQTLKQRYPLGFILAVAGMAAALVYILADFFGDGTSTLDPWRSAALVGTLVLWTFTTLEANALARLREGRRAWTFAACAYAFGYQWSVFMMLFQWNEATALTNFIAFGLAGAVFGSLLTYMSKPASMAPAARFFEEGHIINEGGLRAVVFKVWPFATLGILT